jgi:hypothetical protein
VVIHTAPRSEAEFVMIVQMVSRRGACWLLWQRYRVKVARLAFAFLCNADDIADAAGASDGSDEYPEYAS